MKETLVLVSFFSSIFLMVLSMILYQRKKMKSIDLAQIEALIRSTLELHIMYMGYPMPKNEEKVLRGFVESAYESGGLLEVNSFIHRWESKIKLNPKRCGRKE